MAAAERAGARADLARFLAACYYEPAAEFGEERLFDSMRAVAARIDTGLAALAERLGAVFAAADLTDLQVDYTRLFLGPVQALAQPYASVWLKGDPNALMQDSTLAVQALYAEGGFEIGGDFQELPDHVAAELEFLYLLIWRENDARARGDDAQAAAAGSLKRRFLDGHLGLWLGPFLLAVHDGAKSDFYETLAELTEAFVRLEATQGAATNG